MMTMNAITAPLLHPNDTTYTNAYDGSGAAGEHVSSKLNSSSVMNFSAASSMAVTVKITNTTHRHKQKMNSQNIKEKLKAVLLL